MNLSYLDRNFFKGAELLRFNLSGSYEAQLSGSNLYSYSWNPQIELILPRFLIPINVAANRRIIPKTRLSFSYNYLKRVNYFDMRQFNFTYGFTWKENIRTEHQLDPISVSYTSIGDRSLDFTELLNTNPYLRKSYEEQFIAGSSYSYTYNEQVVSDKKIQFFFQFNSELAGNAISLVKRIAGEEISSENPSKLAGSIYSQYARFSIDGRGYFNMPNKNKFAVRLFAGIAAPYGNSSSLPYSRQFFSGGPNSIRAFPINSVGPGIVLPDRENRFLQSGGDLKLEMNAEFRFNIYRFFNGAIFTDAGNVWLLKSNPANTGSPFSFSSFSKELALGTGIGLRLDFSFVVLRLDLATPLRKPWLEDNKRWVLDQINFGSSTWRRENLVLNIAIGHPF
jgi:outer membrane protein assembly factor BamA